MPTLAKKCLLIKLPDGGRQLFTHRKNYPNLIEFSKKFNAQLEVVKASNAQLLELDDVAKCICDASYTMDDVQYEVIKPSVNPKKTYFTQCTSFSGLGARERMMKKVSDVRQCIYDMFTSGQPVRIKDLESKFQKHQLSVSTIYRHVNFVKEQLESEGHAVTKVSPGVYKLVKNSN